MRCTICREKLPRNTFRWWRQSHYQSLHADYAKSIGRWYRNFFALLGPFLLALILTEYLWFSYGGLYVVIAGITILLFIAFCVYEIDLLFRRVSRRYAREWRGKNLPQYTRRTRFFVRGSAGVWLL